MLLNSLLNSNISKNKLCSRFFPVNNILIIISVFLKRCRLVWQQNLNIICLSIFLVLLVLIVLIAFIWYPLRRNNWIKKFNPLQPSVAFLYTPWKHQKSFRFSDVFRGYRKATPGCNGLKAIFSSYINQLTSLYIRGTLVFHRFPANIYLFKAIIETEKGVKYFQS